MARPVRNVISQGVSSWDADVDANFSAIVDTPFPMYKVDTVGELPTASSYADCFALVRTEIYMSDGTSWSKYNGVSDYQADSTASDLSTAVSDFNSLLAKLRASGIMGDV